MRAHNLLANGMGGIDWAGLPLVAAYLGITDAECFVEALETVVTHRPPRADGQD